MSDALVKSEPKGLDVQLAFRAEEWELVKKQIAPPTATNDEVAFFRAWCERAGLNPLLKEAFLVARRAKGPDGQWFEKHEPMASEAGVGTRAEEQPDYLGIDGDAVYLGDAFEVARVGGEQTIRHTWTVEARHALGWKVLGAWAHVRRAGKVTPPVFVTLPSRVQSRNDGQATQFWAKDPAGMIAKCARMAAYRLAFRKLFAGVYIAEESHLEERDITPEPPAATATATAALLAKLAPLKVATPPAPAPAPRPSPFARVGQESTVGAAAWGPLKGTRISEMTDSDIQQTIQLGEERLRDLRSATAAWVPAVKAGLEELKSAQAARASVRATPENPPPPAREPGSEG